LKISVEITGSILKAKLLRRDKSLGNEINYTFRLKIWSNIIETVENQDVDYVEFTLKKSAFYKVDCLIKKNNDVLCEVNSNCVEYIDKSSEEIYKEFESFLEKPAETAIPELEFVKTNAPYQDIGIYWGADKNLDICSSLREYCFSEKFSFTDFRLGLNKKCYAVSTEPAKTKKGITHIFSGVAKVTDKSDKKAKLILGNTELAENNNIKITDVIDSIGEFLLIAKISEKSIELHTDYFSQMKLTYYKDRDIFVAASSFHFLLILLKRLNVKLNINKSASELEFVHLGQLFQQKLTRESEIQNVYFLPIDKRIVLNENSILFKNTAIYKDMTSPPEYSDEMYEKMLGNIKDELTENAEAIITHPKFKHVVCDITGGIDSRIALAALTNAKDPEKKLALTSIDGSHVPVNDLQNAIAISKALNIPFDTAEVSVKSMNSPEHFSKIYSLYLGTYYLYGNLAYSDIKNDEYIRVGGRNGEISRCYMGRFYENFEDIDNAGDMNDSDALIRELCKYKGNGTINMSPDGKLLAETAFESEFSQIPGLDIKNKFENLYINTRTCTHFANRTYSRYLCFNFNVVVSKYAYKLRQMCWGQKFLKTYGLKLQMDTLAVLNPLLAVIEFGNEEYNIFYRARAWDLKIGEKEQIKIETERDEYNEAAKLRKSREIRIGAIPDTPVKPNQVYEFEMTALKYIAEYEINGETPFKDSIAFPCFRYLQKYYNAENAVPMYLNVLKSKILSLYYILKTKEEQI